ncbi:MAG: hypothetical protein IJB57_04095 [Clostridia bacterium]|nr:hypothetical protein [Clostridia bacterium]
MIGKRLTKFAEDNNLTIYDEIAYGYYNGYMMTLNQSHHYTISVSFAVRIYNTPSGRKYSELLCDHKNKVTWSVSDIIFTESYLEIFFNDTGNTIEKIKSCIDTVTEMMKVDGVAANDICSVCGDPIDPNASGLYLYEGKAQIMNHNCVTKLNNELAEKKRKYNSLKYRILVKLKRKRRIIFPKKIVKLK